MPSTGLMRVVADRIGEFLRLRVEFGRRRARTGARSDRADRCGRSGRPAPAAAPPRSARPPRPSAARVSAGARPCVAELRGGAQASSWSFPFVDLHGSATGVHITCSMRCAPVASITSRSKPSATPQAGGMARERGEKILVHRIALAVDALLLGHRRLEARALLGGVGQFAEGVGEFDAAGIELEALGHLVAARLSARASAASGSGYSYNIVARPMPSCGSTRSARMRLKMSPQVSSAPMLDAGFRRGGGKRRAIALARPRPSPADRCRHGARTPPPQSRVPARRTDRRSCRGNANCFAPAARAASASSAAQSSINVS